MVFLLILSPLVSMPFLGHPLSSTLVYIWSRRNPDTRLSFLGLLVFSAPYLPWVLMAFSLTLHGTVPKDELMGVVIGHIWYFFTDVYPPLHGGSRPLDPPMWWRRIFGMSHHLFFVWLAVAKMIFVLTIILKRADRARRPRMVSTTRLQSLALPKLRRPRSAKAYGGVRESTVS